MTNQTCPNLNIHNENDRIEIVRHHFEQKGYRVHSGLQFGCELVLYADDPDRVHSDFCVHIVPSHSHMDWRMIQSLVRSQNDFHKTLILTNIRLVNDQFIVDELAIATEHAPFRYKNKKKHDLNALKAGTQSKKKKSNLSK